MKILFFLFDLIFEDGNWRTLTFFLAGTVGVNALAQRALRQFTQWFFFFGASSSNHCLAALDLGADVEQLFVVPSSRTVRPCSPWGSRWITHWRTTWSTVCSYTPHSQAAEEAIPRLYKVERKGPTPVRRGLNLALLGRVAPRGWVPVSVMKMLSLVGFSAYSTFHWWSNHLLLSDEVMSCCAADTNSCLDLRRRASALDGRVSAEWSRCSGSMARRARDSVTPLRRSSAGCMPARIGRLSAGVGHRHPVTMLKASLMAGSPTEWL